MRILFWRILGASHLLTLRGLWSWESSSLDLTRFGCLVMICGLGQCPSLILSAFQQHIMPYNLLCLLSSGLIWSSFPKRFLDTRSSCGLWCVIICSTRWDFGSEVPFHRTRAFFVMTIRRIFCPCSFTPLLLLLFGPLFTGSVVLIPAFRDGLLLLIQELSIRSKSRALPSCGYQSCASRRSVFHLDIT